MEICGIDELRQRYVDDIVVESSAFIRDGIPFAVKLRQLRPIALIAIGRGIPIPKAKANGGEEDDWSDFDERYEYMKKVVARSVVAVREAYSEDGRIWSYRWRDVEVLCETEPSGPGQIHVSSIDFLDNVTRCWNAIFANMSEGGRLAGTGAATFPDRGPGDVVPAGKALRKVATRDRLRKERRARV